MEIFDNYIADNKILLETLLIVIAAVIALYFYLKNPRKVKRQKIASGSDTDIRETVYNRTTTSSMEALKEAGTILILGIAVILILDVHGVNVTAGLAGLGIAGTIIGLAMQDYLKDTIMGLRIARDHFFEVGETVRLNGITGVVVGFTLRLTRIENLENHSIYTICNGEIREIERMSHLLDIVIPFPYEITHEEAKRTVEKICSRVWMLEGIENCYYKGVYEFGSSSVNYKLRCFSKPENHPDLRLGIQAIVREVLAANGIEIPFNQLDVHMK